MTAAPVIEIFSGIQGEGPRVGTRTLFLRLLGCNRNCLYCDTPRTEQGLARIERAPGGRDFEHRPSLMTSDEILQALARLQGPCPVHACLGLTGGEPLLHLDLLRELLPQTRALGMKRYLETNGTLPDALAEILPEIDEVAMDIKLESATGEPTPWESHEAFMRTGSRRPLIVKLVVSSSTPDEELSDAAKIMDRVRPPDLQIVIQPVWREEGLTPATRLIQMADLFATRGWTARVIPQIHKMLRDL